MVNLCTKFEVSSFIHLASHIPMLGSWGPKFLKTALTTSNLGLIYHPLDAIVNLYTKFEH